jgi:hypothetical protein
MFKNVSLPQNGPLSRNERGRLPAVERQKPIPPSERDFLERLRGKSSSDLTPSGPNPFGKGFSVLPSIPSGENSTISSRSDSPDSGFGDSPPGSPVPKDYEWQAYLAPSADVPPAPDVLKPTSPTKKTLSESTRFESAVSSIEERLKLSSKTLGGIPIQLPPLEFTLFEDGSPDRLNPVVMRRMEESLNTLDKIKWGSVVSQDDLKAVLPILEDAILNQTGLTTSLSQNEIRNMMAMALRMRSEGVPEDEINRRLSSAHRGQISRVKVTRATPLYHAYNSGSGEYDSAALLPSESSVEPPKPKVFSNKSNLDRQSQSLPLSSSQRNARAEYIVPERTEGYVYAKAPGLAEGIVPGAGKTGGSFQFIPCDPTQVVFQKSDRVTSGNPRHRLLPTYRSQDDAKSKAAIDKFEKAHQLMKQTVLEKRRADHELSQKFDAKKTKMVSAIGRIISREMTQQASVAPHSSVQLSTQHIYEATDTLLSQESAQKALGLKPGEVCPLWIKIELWRAVETDLSRAPSVARPVVDLVRDVASLVTEAASFLPLGAPVEKVAEVIGSEVVTKLVDKALDTFSNPKSMGIVGLDGSEQVPLAYQNSVIAHLDKAISFLGGASEKGVSLQSALDGREDEISSTIGKVLGKALPIGSVVSGVLNVVKHGIEVGSAVKWKFEHQDLRRLVKAQMQNLQPESEI